MYIRAMTKTQKPHTATCTRCHATLRSEASLKRGMGAHCARQARREQAVAADGYKPEQIDAARQAIEDGAIIPLRGAIFLVVSSDGSEVHRTTATACSCPAGVKGRRCFHRATVLLAA